MTSHSEKEALDEIELVISLAHEMLTAGLEKPELFCGKAAKFFAALDQSKYVLPFAKEALGASDE